MIITLVAVPKMMSTGPIVFQQPASGWTEDTEFGRWMMGQIPGTPFRVKFFAGRPTSSGYDPLLWVLSSPVPSGVDLKTLVDQNVAFETSSVGGLDPLGTESVDREALTFLGIPAEKVTYINSPDNFSPQGFETLVVYVLTGSQSWQIQCGGSRGLQDELVKCKEALFSFRFEQ